MKTVHIELWCSNAKKEEEEVLYYYTCALHFFHAFSNSGMESMYVGYKWHLTYEWYENSVKETK